MKKNISFFSINKKEIVKKRVTEKGKAKEKKEKEKKNKEKKEGVKSHHPKQVTEQVNNTGLHKNESVKIEEKEEEKIETIKFDSIMQYNSQVEPEDIRIKEVSESNHTLTPAVELPSDETISDIIELERFNKPEAIPVVGSSEQEKTKGGEERTEEKISYQVISFLLAGEEYCFEISEVSEIGKVTNLTAIPNAPDYMIGLMEYRNQIIPIINMKRKLNLVNKSVSNDLKDYFNEKIIIVEVTGKKVGLLIDKLIEVIKKSDMNFQPPPTIISGLEDIIYNIGKIGERIITFLDVNKIFTIKEKQILTEVIK